MLTIEKIAQIIQGEPIQLINNEPISELLIDSRMLLFPKKTLFFAIKTQRNDGHAFIHGLYNLGVRNFVITQTDFPVGDFDDANFYLVKNAVTALQLLAIEHRKTLKNNVVGITGSNGKTIVKEWCKQILEPYFQITASPKSYNSQIGVPLSVWQASPQDEVCIFEAGISQPAEMQQLAKIIQPNIGIFTHIGSAHNENFDSIEQKIREKLQLFEHVSTLIFCLNDTQLSSEIQEFTKNKSCQIFSWGNAPEASLQITHKTILQNETVIECCYQDHTFSLTIPFVDRASLENVMHCISLALLLSIPINEITEQVRRLKSLALRLELHKGIHHCTIINDSYNLDMDSLRMALDFEQQQAKRAKKTLILSDIPQTGRDKSELYHAVAQLIAKKAISRFIGIGPDLMQQQSLFPDGSLFFADTQQFIEQIPNISFQDETILLKGARRFRFEDINSVLQKQTHETVLEINLNSLIHNFNHFRSLAPNTKIMAMVKAFAYGSGSIEVAHVLQYHGVDYLCVAYIDEGITLRKSGIRLPIMVMNPEASGFEDVAKYQLEPEIYNFRTLQMLEDLVQNQLFYRDEEVRFHLKLDTGMHRLGFEEKELETLIARLLQLKNCRLQSVFSHFSCSDDASCDHISHLQLQRFEAMSQKIAKALPYPILRHISNSAAISRLPEARFDMVRLGIGLYGVASDTKEQRHLEVVNSLYSVVSQIKTIEKGEYVGYSQGFRAERTMRVATVPMGYADGLHRALKNRGKVLINGTLCPMIGNICMDMFMVDVSHLEVHEGDKVEIFGKNCPVSELARAAETIPYELFTCISPRVKRVYVQE